MHGACAVFSDVGDEGESVARRNVKAAAPLIENALTVRKQTPEKGINLCVRMFRESQGHGERQGESLGGISPPIGVGERKLAIASLADETDFPAVNDSD